MSTRRTNGDNANNNNNNSAIYCSKTCARGDIDRKTIKQLHMYIVHYTAKLHVIGI